MPKGVYKHKTGFNLSPIWKKRLSLSHKGKRLSKEHKKHLSISHIGIQAGPKHPFWGKKLSREHRKNLSKNHANFSGKKHPLFGKHHSEETRRKMSLAKVGKKIGNRHWNWHGGTTSLRHRIRESLEYKRWRQVIFERDGFSCIWCGQLRGNIEADHIIPFSKIIEKLKFEQGIDNLYEKAMRYPLLWDINNGRTLCKKCHQKTDTYPIALKNYN